MCKVCNSVFRFIFREQSIMSSYNLIVLLHEQKTAAQTRIILSNEQSLSKTTWIVSKKKQQLKLGSIMKACLWHMKPQCTFLPVSPVCIRKLFYVVFLYDINNYGYQSIHVQNRCFCQISQNFPCISKPKIFLSALRVK